MPLLEIEQKFTFNPALIPALLRKIHPHSHSHSRLPFSLPPPLKTTTFHDTYYDSQNELSTAGLWLRKRRHLVDPSTTSPSTNNRSSSSSNNNKIITTATDEEEEAENEEWEAKQSHQNSSFLRSTFSETRDPQKISSLLRSHFPESHPRPRSNNNNNNNNDIRNKHNTRIRTDFNHLFSLDTIAAFTTTRTTLHIPFTETTTDNHNDPEKSFTVALDSTDFGHRVGEVELMTDDADAAHAAIDALVRRYAWFFVDTTSGSGPPPKGKLTAYFEKFGYPKVKSSTDAEFREVRVTENEIIKNAGVSE